MQTYVNEAFYLNCEIIINSSQIVKRFTVHGAGTHDFLEGEGVWPYSEHVCFGLLAHSVNLLYYLLTIFH